MFFLFCAFQSKKFTQENVNLYKYNHKKTTENWLKFRNVELIYLIIYLNVHCQFCFPAHLIFSSSLNINLFNI